MMRTYAELLEDALSGETIVGCVIGDKGWDRHDPEMPAGILTWNKARPLLNYRFVSEYGAPQVHAVYVWTLTRVAFVVQYDGTNTIYTIPVAPTDVIPTMPGG